MHKEEIIGTRRHLCANTNLLICDGKVVVKIFETISCIQDLFQTMNFSQFT